MVKIHNLMEEIVKAELESVCKDIEKDPVYQGVCTCEQCRTDAACYALNRIPQRYVASNRGLAREEIFSFERQQVQTDLITLLFEGFSKVAHNSRPNRSHNRQNSAGAAPEKPVFNFPAIAGRILDGRNFAPLFNAQVTLYLDNTLAPMKNENWQNPCPLNVKTQGAFTFWPDAHEALSPGEQKSFEFSLQVEAEGFEPVLHAITINATGELVSPGAISMDNTLKLPNLYMFPPETAAV